MNKDNDIMDNKVVECGGSIFFDWSCVNNGGGDVYYTFKGIICGCLKGGVNNALYGKRVNLSEMYNKMIDDVSEYIIGGGVFLDIGNDGADTMNRVSKYTTAKYGISIGWVINAIKSDMSGYTMDGIYGYMIERAGGVDCIDWMRLYENNRGFSTNRSDILLYIANGIISGGIYKYFVDRYKLRAVGVEVNDRDRRVIVLEWEGGRRLIPLSMLVWNKRDWWRLMTYNDSSKIDKERTKIRDYDVLLNGRSEDEVLPDVCPIDNNIILNYTRIDFSVNNDNNLDECRRHNEMNGGDKIWSYASIDRIDSNREYDYDNVEIISQYYNTQVKNCASISQVGKLYYYQLKNLIDKKINKVGVKAMTNDMLCKSFDDLGVYVNLIEIVHNYRKILFKEINRRDKKRSKV